MRLAGARSSPVTESLRDKKTATIFGDDGRGCAYLRTTQLRKVLLLDGWMDGWKEGRQAGRTDERAGDRLVGRSVGGAEARGAVARRARGTTWRGRVVMTRHRAYAAYTTARGRHPGSPGVRAEGRTSVPAAAVLGGGGGLAAARTRRSRHENSA